MSKPPRSPRPEDSVLWDVVEEHLAEAEFLIEQLQRAFDSPTLSLADLEAGIEARLGAHVDGLALCDAPVHDLALKKVLAEPDPAEPARIVAAGLAALAVGRFGVLELALGHPEAAVRDAAVQACSLARGQRVDDWLRKRLREVNRGEERASLLRIGARRGFEPPPLVEWLQGDDPRLAQAAAEAARHADARRHMAVIEYLLDHPEVDVRETALVTALAWRSARAFSLCETWALGDRPRPLPMALYATLGNPAHHDRLARKLGSPSAPSERALCARLVRKRRSVADPDGAPVGPGPDRRQDRGASHFDDCRCRPGGRRFRRRYFTGRARVGAPPPSEDPGARAALPPLHEDDLDADLVPLPEEGLPRPNAHAIRLFWEQRASSLAPGVRYLGGRPAGVDVSLDYVARAPLRRRHMLALGLGIQTGGRVWIDTRAFSATQRGQIARARGARPVMR
jgi:hypothetical protein